MTFSSAEVGSPTSELVVRVTRCGRRRRVTGSKRVAS
jgi:hypothetical protein